MPKPTHIDGIASSQAIDTAGEIVDLKGLDISSLVGAALNWEHESKLPAQIVGKILLAHKIYSEEDCQNERQRMYWNKCKIPFLYVMGRLFDDKKPSAVEVAALFKDDAEHPEEADMLGFSVEGAKIEKQGTVITRSIARKVTIAHMPANKTCIAEMVPTEKKKDSNDIDALFKGELELFQFEPTYVEIIEKKETPLKKEAFATPQAAMIGRLAFGGGAAPAAPAAPSAPASAPSRPAPSGGGSSGAHPIHPTMVAIGQSAFGKKEEDEDHYADLEKSAPGWSRPSLKVHSSKTKGAGIHFEHSQHGKLNVTKTPIGNFEVRHNDKLIGVSASPHKAASHAKKYMGKLSASSNLNKALEAGSGMAAPSELSGGAALGKESLDRKMKKSEWKKESTGHETLTHSSGHKFKIQSQQNGSGYALHHTKPSGETNIYSTFGKPEHAKSHADGLMGKSEPMQKKEKSKWYSRAEDAYNSWDKKAHFKQYMQKRMPNMAEGEIDAIGKVLALKKTLQAEGNLSKMYASYFGKEEMDKGTDIMMASEYIHGLPKGDPRLGEHKGHVYRRTAPPNSLQGNKPHWNWAIKHPDGKISEFKAHPSTGGSRDAVHAHIESLASKKK